MRNIMAELEENGLLCRPHTSAGRIPSDPGFRLYVDNLPRPSAPPPAVRRELSTRMTDLRREFAEDIDWVAKLIAEATLEAGVAVRPLGESPMIEAVSLVRLGDRRVLGVVIEDNGTIDKRILELSDALDREQLQTLSNFLTGRLAGRPTGSVDALCKRVSEAGEASIEGDLRVVAAEIAKQLFSTESSDIEVRIVGTENLLAAEDFSEIDRVRKLLAALEDRARMAADFRQAFAAGRTSVLIGEESPTTAQGDLGIVATLYFRDRRRAGAVGVVGPRRMDYQRIVPLVEYVGDTLTEMLATPGAPYA
jgi:heat-inducible transcriptional repressor